MRLPPPRGAVLVAAWLAAGGCTRDDPDPTPTAGDDDDDTWPPRTHSGATPLTEDADEDGYAILDGDCDDTDPARNPSATEVPGNGVDEDCDGSDRAVQLLSELASAIFVGQYAWGSLGDSLDCGPDATGPMGVPDGVGDLLLGEPDTWDGNYRSEDPDTRDKQGRLYVISGTSLGKSTLDYRQALICGEQTDNIGDGVLFAPDQDDDGAPEVYTSVGVMNGDVVRSAFRFADPTAVGLGLNDAAGWLRGTETWRHPKRFGRVGDLDHDGVEDVAIGGPLGITTGYPGDVLIQWGALTGEHPGGRGTLVIASDVVSDAFGEAVEGADVTGDGWNDLIVGAPGYLLDPGYRGAVYLFEGPLTPTTGNLTLADATVFTPNDQDATTSGSRVRTRGDLNGDGIDDLVLSEWTYGRDRGGRAWVFYGPPPRGRVALEDADVIVHPEGPWDFFGFDVALADYDGDGLDDLMVGATSDPYYGPPRPGRVYVFLSPLPRRRLNAADADVILRGDQWSWDLAGKTLAARDLDHDGRAELLVGAPMDNEGDRAGGKVYLLPGGAGL